ncbi:MAG TPA: hypothetical protein VNV86_08050 [Candidatus Acidoferrum sp.]|nr:hypothetical protein [Candidatus Acidoferrum sp.]
MEPTAIRAGVREAMSRELAIAMELVEALGPALASSHVVATCTPARRALFATVREGTFIAPAGADTRGPAGAVRIGGRASSRDF